jgi:magnesium chelatase subunit I
LSPFSSLIFTSITGKIELVYEGEQEGADHVAKILIDEAVITEFEKIFPRVSKLEKEGKKNAYTDLIAYFNNNTVQLNYSDSDKDFYAKLKSITPLTEIIEEFGAQLSKEDQNFSKELILWALTINKKLDKSESQNTLLFDSAGIGKYYSN